MDKKLIEQWAREANLEEAVAGLFYASSYGLERFAALVAAHEREQCALVCDLLPAPDLCNRNERSLWDVATLACCDAIRTRDKVTAPG